MPLMTEEDARQLQPAICAQLETIMTMQEQQKNILLEYICCLLHTVPFKEGWEDTIEEELTAFIPDAAVFVDWLSTQAIKRATSSQKRPLGPKEEPRKRICDDAFYSQSSIGHENSTDPSQQSILGSSSGSLKKCSFWPNCAFGDSCWYYHPTEMCPSYPNCRDGDNCLYIHIHRNKTLWVTHSDDEEPTMEEPADLRSCCTGSTDVEESPQSISQSAEREPEPAPEAPDSPREQQESAAETSGSESTKKDPTRIRPERKRSTTFLTQEDEIRVYGFCFS